MNPPSCISGDAVQLELADYGGEEEVDNNIQSTIASTGVAGYKIHPPRILLTLLTLLILLIIILLLVIIRLFTPTE